jgi:hypothetical protein
VRATQANNPMTALTPATTLSIPNSPDGPPLSADAIERALVAASPGTGDLILERMLTAWTPVDPQAAARFAELQADPFLREVALRVVAQVWTQADPDSAVPWAASLGDVAERDQVIEVVALAMSGSDPRAALELLAQRANDKSRDATRVGVITSWAGRDFAAAQSWAEAQPPGAARDDIVLRLVFQRAQTDPPAAIQLASQMLSDQEARREAYASIIRQWVARDPERAREWAASTDVETRRRVDAELAIP